jgi:thiosulfate reductase cytochrome b subunit
MTDARVKSNERQGLRLHPLPVRIMHWTNAIAMIIMIGSGWKIYNDEVLFGRLHFPDWITIGGEQQGALQWHFLGMWILALNGLIYLIYGIATGRFRRMLYPIRLHHLQHDVLTVYNAVQRLLYAGIILIGIVQVVSGFFIWKPMQYSELTTLFYSFQGGRLVHFLGMAAIVGFLVVHVALALLVPKTIVNMLSGGPKVSDRPAPTSPPEASVPPVVAG